MNDSVFSEVENAKEITIQIFDWHRERAHNLHGAEKLGGHMKDEALIYDLPRTP
jgi:hypothetical protein